MARGGGGGRIRPHERDTNDSVAILGVNLKIQAAHSQGVRNTERRALVLRTKQNGAGRAEAIRICLHMALGADGWTDTWFPGAGWPTLKPTTHALG